MNGRPDPRLHPEGRRCPCGNHAARPRPARVCRPLPLWNSVEQIEKAKGQPACPRDRGGFASRTVQGTADCPYPAYVKDNFVDKGMCADFAIHDKGTGNPHVHIMLTVRPLKENGAWGAKCRKAYDLTKTASVSGWERRLEEPPGGHHRLERQRECGDLAGGMGGLYQPGIGGRRSAALVDHRSYKRQGIDKIPSVHLGPAASQMEKRGIRTDKEKSTGRSPPTTSCSRKSKPALPASTTGLKPRRRSRRASSPA